jgi:hypothetical protein
LTKWGQARIVALQRNEIGPRQLPYVTALSRINSGSKPARSMTESRTKKIGRKSFDFRPIFAFLIRSKRGAMRSIPLEKGEGLTRAFPCDFEHHSGIRRDFAPGKLNFVTRKQLAVHDGAVGIALEIEGACQARRVDGSAKIDGQRAIGFETRSAVRFCAGVPSLVDRCLSNTDGIWLHEPIAAALGANYTRFKTIKVDKNVHQNSTIVQNFSFYQWNGILHSSRKMYHLRAVGSARGVPTNGFEGQIHGCD